MTMLLKSSTDLNSIKQTLVLTTHLIYTWCEVRLAESLYRYLIAFNTRARDKLLTFCK